MAGFRTAILPMWLSKMYHTHDRSSQSEKNLSQNTIGIHTSSLEKCKAEKARLIQWGTCQTMTKFLAGYIVAHKYNHSI